MPFLQEILITHLKCRAIGFNKNKSYIRNLRFKKRNLGIRYNRSALFKTKNRI